MTLSMEQQRLVEEYLGLVRRVIKDCVHVPAHSIYTYDDLEQIGRIGLCEAAASYRQQGAAAFKTYAYVLIRNELYRALEYASLRAGREVSEDTLAQDRQDTEAVSPQQCAEQQMLAEALTNALRTAQMQMRGVTRKGVDAILLRGQGYSCKEIAELMGAKTNEVTAWMSKARKHLRANAAFRQVLEACA